MTVKELKEFANEIPNKLNKQLVTVCGDLVENSTENFNLSWMDCSDGFLLFVEPTKYTQK